VETVIVEKTVEVEKIVEKTVEVEKIVEKTVEVEKTEEPVTGPKTLVICQGRNRTRFTATVVICWRRARFSRVSTMAH
jgi:hypothetical protein